MNIHSQRWNGNFSWNFLWALLHLLEYTLKSTNRSGPKPPSLSVAGSGWPAGLEGLYREGGD